MRLGVFTDPVLFRLGDEVTADRAYLRFVLGLADRMDELVLFGRVRPTEHAMPYLVSPRARVRVVPLPYYPSLARVRAVLGAWRRSQETFAAELDRLDAVWLFAPNPFSLGFARIARQRGVPVALAIRQDFPQYIHHRHPRRPDAYLAANALEHAFRRLARRCPTIVVGDELERTFTRAGAQVLSVGLSQIASSDIVRVEDAISRSWDGNRRVLSVGRLEREKNPVLLPEVLARLLSGEGEWSLEIIGEGREQSTVIDRARTLGVADALDISGYVAAGETLWNRYRASHAFLHVSRTEGVPSVLFEAQAAGTPIVASDVGGVSTVVRHEVTGLLIPPNDAPAAATALERLATDEQLRTRVITASLAEVAQRTSDLELDRISAFLETHLGAKRAARTSRGMP